MNCPKCNRENEDSALFCIHCGSSLKPVEMKESNFSNVILFIWVILKVVFSVGIFLYRTFYDNWYEDGRGFYVALQIMNNLTLILPSLAIKNKTLKIIGIILSACLVNWWIVENILFAIRG